MIATAGKVLSEGDLRAYIRCSQLYHYGGKLESSLETKVAKRSLEWLTSHCLRKSVKDPSPLLMEAVLRAFKSLGLQNELLEGQINDLTNKTILWLYEFYKLFDPTEYFIVTGPLPYRVVVSKTPIELDISAVLRNRKNQTLHIISFTPHKHRHSQVNDPITHMKLHVLKGFVKRHKTGRELARLHTLWVKKEGKFGYSHINASDLNPNYLKTVKGLMRSMESGFHFPVLPCTRYCSYKRKCFPGVKEADE